VLYDTTKDGLEKGDVIGVDRKGMVYEKDEPTSSTTTVPSLVTRIVALMR
jgi:hypothetical protein